MKRYFTSHIFRSSLMLSCLLAAGGMPLCLMAPSAAAKTPPISTSNNAAPHIPIQILYNALQKAETNTSNTQQRRKIITPAVDQAFDMDTIVRRSIGLRYEHLSDSERLEIINGFRAFTVARYASAFKPGTNAVFTVSPTPRNNPTGGVIVHTTLRGKADPESDATSLDYVMINNNSGWHIVDILIDGHISQVGAQRADFKTIFSQSGARGLAQSLNQKSDNFLHE